MQRLIDRPELQRLRHIRQNGLTNLVFHGAEHSRFTHSMGVAHLAGEMYDRICRNMDEQPDLHRRFTTCAAALLHDIGHGPFSHTLEEILESLDVPFHHEKMTRRIIEESGIRDVLVEMGDGVPAEVVAYIDKKQRPKGDDGHWSHKIVSSQLDADRLDYLLRDAGAAGLRGHTYDLPRLLDMLHHIGGTRIAVHRGGLETVEGYLVALDQMYRAVYFHHTSRAASALIRAIVTRALRLGEDPGIFPDPTHPLRILANEGDDCNLDAYLRLGEYHVWSLIEAWRHHPDPVLSDLSRRLHERRLFKTLEIRTQDFHRIEMVRDRARKLTLQQLGFVDQGAVDLYVCIDTPNRTSYKRYDFTPDAPDDSIWILGEGRDDIPIEDHPDSKIVDALKNTQFFNRLIVPAEIRAALERELGGRSIQ